MQLHRRVHFVGHDLQVRACSDCHMIFSDGECPNCQYQQLSLNTDDLLECPQCHLVCANTDGLIASVMPYLGTGDFRFEDCDLRSMSGVGFAKACPGSVLSEDG